MPNKPLEGRLSKLTSTGFGGQLLSLVMFGGGFD